MSESYQAQPGVPVPPPPELVREWLHDFHSPCLAPGEATLHIAAQAARWGAEETLHRICEWLDGPEIKGAHLIYPLLCYFNTKLISPKPPSLKEQALKALDSATYQPGTDFKQIDPTRSAILRRALEQLDD